MKRDPRVDPQPGDIIANDSGTRYVCHQRIGDRVTFNHAGYPDDWIFVKIQDNWTSRAHTVVYAAPPAAPRVEPKLRLDSLHALVNELNRRAANNLIDSDAMSGTASAMARGFALGYATSARLLDEELAQLEGGV